MQGSRIPANQKASSLKLCCTAVILVCSPQHRGTGLVSIEILQQVVSHQHEIDRIKVGTNGSVH